MIIQNVLKSLSVKLMSNIFLSIGSNIGLRDQNLSESISKLEDLENTSVISQSSIYRTEPLYNPDQPYFFNKVIEIKTKLNPYELLGKFKSIELIMGRNLDNSHNFPRIIDIDILVFGDLDIYSNKLIIPHPKICERRFVLEPWSEIAPSYIIVNKNMTIKQLYNKYLNNKFKNQKVELINN